MSRMAFFTVAAVAVAAAGIGILLPPWSLRASVYGPDSETDPYFSASYLEARARFIAGAKSTRGVVGSEHITRDDAQDLDLTMDWVFVEGTNPDQIVVHSSGAHGVEGFGGSAIQIRLLQQLAGANSDGAKVPGPNLLIIHAVNPYGFHFKRRFNENNVDLNRNFLLTEEEWDEARARPLSSFHYQDIDGLLNPPRALAWWEWYATIPALILRHALYLPHVRRAVVSGQFQKSSGLYFGGRSRERSTEVLLALFKRFDVASKAAVVEIDVHSGLGPSGVDSLMVDDSEVEFRNATNVLSAKFHERLTTPGSGGASAAYDTALGCRNIRRVASRAKTSSHITQEFGTLPGVLVVWSLIFENAAYHYAPRTDPTREYASGRLLDAFYVNTPEWKQSILRRGVEIFEDVRQQLRALPQEE